MKKFLSIMLLAVLLPSILAIGMLSTSASNTGKAGLIGSSNVVASDIRKARERLEKLLFRPTELEEGVVGISHAEDPPMISVYIEEEKYRSKILEEFDGFKVEVIVTGRFTAYLLV